MVPANIFVEGDLKLKKAILISAANDFAGNANVARFTTPLAPPMNILALGSYLVAHDVPVELIDAQMDFGFGFTRAAERIASQRVAQYLRDQADAIAWIGISQLSNALSGTVLAQEIHEALPDIPVIFGGYFPSGNYRFLLENYPYITAVVRGDGEAAALQISRSLAKGQSFLSEETPNLAWRDAGEIQANSIQSMVLDDLPILDFRLLHNPDYYQIIALMTSRGCPGQCNYCPENYMRPYVGHSPDWVAQQLTHVETELPNDRIFIYDPIFGVGKKRTLHISQIMRKHRFTYAIESRVDILTPDLIPALRAGGVEVILFGIESGSVATLLRMNKVRSEGKARAFLRNTMKVIRACFENDVTPFTSVMLGFPGDSETDYQVTLDLVKQIRELHEEVAAQTGNKVGYVSFAFYTKVYSGTPLAECIAQGYPDVILQSGPFVGERTVLSPSSGLNLEVTQRYQIEVSRQSVYSSKSTDRLQRFGIFSMEAFLTAHPELIDDQGVVNLGESFRRFPQEVSLTSMLMDFDKSKG